MLAKNRLPGSGHTTPSPPASPRRSPRYRHGRSKAAAGSRFPTVQPSRTLAHRLSWILLSVLLRRQGIFLFAPLIYISCMLLYMGTVSFDVVPIIQRRPPPGSVYKSPQVYAKLRPEMDADNSTADAITTIWKHSYKGGEWKPYVNKSTGDLPESNGYIYVEANGGLNQQRTSICNAVAVAGYLNATLVIPNFHYHSIWRDPSKFGDIYDEEFFVSTLSNDVRVVDTIPEYLMERFDHNMTNVYNFRVKAWSPIQYYRDSILPKLLEEKIIRISPFANRLSFDAPQAVQRLRCLANYEALKFSKTILTLGETLVKRMKEQSANHGAKYVSVHLRFEEDMVAFSCCIFDGGNQEKQDMIAARERGWKGKFTKPGRVIRPGAIRQNGKCPLTPLEVGLMLRGMGFNKSTYIFLASGEIYDANRTMAPLLEMFPNLQTKEMLASEEELAPYKNFSSRMAAIDYTVCLHSEVFVTTQGGNFPHFLMGHRRYMFGGHSKTIRPDKRKLAILFDNPNIGWRSFKRQMLNMRSHSDSKGFELKRPNDSIYTFPCPDCMSRRNKTTTPESRLRNMAKARKPKNEEAPGAKTSENTGAKVLHQKLFLSIDFKKRQIYGYTELEVSVPDIGIVGLHAENLGIESVLVDGEPTVFEYYPHHQNSETESNWNSVSDPASAADAAAMEYVGVLKREDTANLLINCCKPSKDLSEQLDSVTLENGSQSSGEAKQNVKLIRINYWVEKIESGIHFDGNIVHTDNQMRRARCWFPCIDDEYHRCSFDLEFTVPHNFVAVSVGKLLYQVMCKEDTTQKTYVYELAIPIAPRWVSLVAGPLEILPDQTNFLISNLCLPHDLSRLRNTMEFFHEAYSYYEDYLSANFPFGFYKQVFLPPEMVVTSSTSGASLSIFSSHILYDERVIDQTIDTRIKLASALAKQWFGVYITPESPNDDWLLDGLAGFLTDMFIKQFLGNNEARYRRYKANCAVCKADDSGAMCLSSSPSCRDLFGTHSIGMHGKIRSWKSGAVLQMLEKQMGSDSFRKILQKIISRAKDPSNSIRSLSTKEFRQFANKIGNLERPFLKEFFQRWVASYGCPVLRIGLSYNKRKNNVEMAALRECTAALDARLSVIGATSDSESRDVDAGWPGIMSIRVYELDGMSDHPKLPMAGDRWQLLELPCHSKLAAKRYQKPKKGGKPDGAEDNVDAIAPLENKTSIESPLAWIKADPEMEYIAEIHLHQPLQMWVNQLEKDGDVVAQAQAIASLEALKQHSFSIVNALKNVLTDSKVFWRIRIAAAFALAKTASEESDWAGLQHLIKFYKSRRFDAEIGLPKPNDFRDFPEYFVLEAIPHAIAIVRGAEGKSPREAVEFILQLLKYNDNSGNSYSDVFWLAVLVQSVGDLEFCQQSLTFLAPLLKRIDRLLQFDRLMPSYNGILTISCIRTLAQTALKLSDSISFDHICKLIEPFRNSDTILQIRIEGSRALLDIEYQSKGISSALLLFMKYLVEESSLRGQVKLCVHTMRLCQIAVGCDSDDCVDTVTLLDLLHLFKSHVVFNNELLRYYLFCIFQILAGRPPTLFGVPKEKPLQLVDVEACIEPKNVFLVPGAEAGEPSLSALGDAKGQSLDVAPYGVPIIPQEMFMPIVPELMLPEPVAAYDETQHLEPRMESQNQPSHENPIVHEIPSDVEGPTEELAHREANPPTKEPQKEPDVVSVSVSHEVKKSVIRIKVRPSGATSRAEGSARTIERSQGIVVRHDIDRGQTSSASVDAPQRISTDAVSISNQNHVEEVNSCHDVGSRMTASIGSVKFASEGDIFGKELQCTAESGKPSTSQKADNNNRTVPPSFLPLDHSMENEAQQKYASLQTLSIGKEKEKKKDKEKKEKKRKREDPVYLEKKRLKKEKKRKEKEMAKLVSSTTDPAKKKIESVAEVKEEEPSDGAMLIKVEPKTEPSTAEARPLPKFRIKLKSKAFNNS